MCLCPDSSSVPVSSCTSYLRLALSLPGLPGQQLQVTLGLVQPENTSSWPPPPVQRAAFTCWEVSSTCKALEEEAPELLTEAAGIARRTRPLMEFILLSAPSESPLHSTKHPMLHVRHAELKDQKAAGDHERRVGTSVCVRKALRQLSANCRHVNSADISSEIRLRPGGTSPRLMIGSK